MTNEENKIENKKPEVIPCSICEGDIDHHKTPEGRVYWTGGHNAMPVTNGRCCDYCNSTVVMPARLAPFLSPNNNRGDSQ